MRPSRLEGRSLILLINTLLLTKYLRARSLDPFIVSTVISLLALYFISPAVIGSKYPRQAKGIGICSFYSLDVGLGTWILGENHASVTNAIYRARNERNREVST